MAAMTRALLLLFALAIRSAGGQQRVHNVIDFHAAGDGKTDDAQVTAAQPNELAAFVCMASQVSDSCHCSKGVPGDMASGLQRRGRAGHGRPRGKGVLAEPGLVSGSLQVTDNRKGNDLAVSNPSLRY
jgi:hypothetical protein